MAFDFNADDVYEIAEQIEKNGADFYQKASETIADKYYQKFLLDLSTMEVFHQRTFAEMRASLSGKEKKPTVFDPNDEAVLYLKALADMRVFYQKQIDMTSIESILMAALSAEKDSIVFYLGMKDLVPEKLGRDRIDAIINEEKKHIQLLGSELLALKK
ncbi:MAG TPA: ferritin family protein [Spirochaetota bacterium]|nr:ferritin family protein [Spirochaetota bacterium]HOD13656.1 ferritin family protein [Spirochaetota bacterium]HPG50797.1 ferritin family protein [Spirochaetota bacterium]HPN12714.1 ferritin family protein [Spirochaetota bacterium]HQL83719.1 ferritin family protein [Spirochaetota bacterium]